MKGVTYSIPVLFKYPLGGGRGFQGVSLQYCKRKYSFCYLPMIIAVLTVDEIEFGGSDLGM